MTVDPQDVSLVFQGGIGKLGSSERLGVHQGLDSARRFYPGAEVILSTWAGSVDEEFPGVTVVESEDPGPIQSSGREILNLNRQLVSSRAGVLRSTRPWVVKLRTDMAFTHGQLFDWYGRVSAPTGPFCQQRILVLNLTGRNPRGPEPYPFHVCDWLYAGTRQDLKRLFSVPNYPPEYADWFDDRTKPANDPYRVARCRYYAETYLWYHFVAPHLGLQLEHSSDNRPEVVTASERVAADCLIVLDVRRAGILSSKHPIPFDYHYVNTSFREWVRLLDHQGVVHTLRKPWLDWEKGWAAYRYFLHPRLVQLWRHPLVYPLRKAWRWLGC